MSTLSVAKVSAAIAVLGTVVTMTMTVIQFLSSHSQANRLAAYQHHQKALESLYATKRSGALHVGSIYTLGSLADEVPTLGNSIANELAVAALDYSSASSASTTLSASPLTSEAGAALQVIGQMRVMSAGLPLNLSGGYFHGASLPYSKFNGVHFWNSDLSGSDFYKAELYGADFRFALLSGTSFAGATMTNTGFYGAVLCPGINTVIPAQNTGTAVPVTLSGAKLDNAVFDNAWLVDAHFESDAKELAENRTYLFRASFKGAELRGADFENAIIDYADFSGADLTDANFSNASGLSRVKTDLNTRVCRTRGLKVPNLPENCGLSSSASSPMVSCVKYNNWRALVARK